MSWVLEVTPGGVAGEAQSPGEEETGQGGLRWRVPPAGPPVAGDRSAAVCAEPLEVPPAATRGLRLPRWSFCSSGSRIDLRFVPCLLDDRVWVVAAP